MASREAASGVARPAAMPPMRSAATADPQHVEPFGPRPEEAGVPASVLCMSMLLDGYIAGPNDGPGHPGGDRFMRLHEWFVRPDGEFFRPSGPAGQLMDEWNATGAIVVGRLTAEQVDHWGGDH